MSAYSEVNLIKKLAELNNSAPSIQQISLWVAHHKKHIQSIVKTWYRELGSAVSSRKLSFLYLANDVVQNCRKHPEVGREFGTVMTKVFNHLAELTFDEKTVNSIARLTKVWEDRQIFDKTVQAEIVEIWRDRKAKVSRDRSPHTPPPPTKKAHTETATDREPTYLPGKVERVEKEAEKGEEDEKEEEEEEQQEQEQARHQNYLDIEFIMEEDGSSLNGNEPPDIVELMEALQDLENSVSSDAIVREKVSHLPAEICSMSQLATVTTEEEGKQLLNQLHYASKLIENYNQRLELEMIERRRVSRMVLEFLRSQKHMMEQAVERLDTFRDKLKKVTDVEDELKELMSSLPSRGTESNDGET